MSVEQKVFLGQGETAYQAWEANWNKVENVDTNSFAGLAQINKLTTEIFFKSEAFAHHHIILGESAQAREAVISAVTFHNFPSEKAVSPEQYIALLQAGHEKEQLARSYILRQIKEGVTFGLKPWEVDVLGTSCKVAGEFDLMCLKWREQVPHNPLNQHAKELGLVNQYTVINQSEKGPEEISYAEAFSDQVGIIASEFTQLAERISSHNPDQEQQSMADYLRAYVGAMTSRDLAQLGDLWRNVDKVWLGVKGKLQTISSREYDYYDPNAIRVFPDFRLIYVNEESKLYQSVEATRQAMIKHLGKNFGGVEIYEQTKNGMSHIQVFPESYDVVFAGSLDFQPAGQFLPNEEAIKKVYGIKDFLNPDGIKDRWDLALELAKKAFPKDADLFKRVNVALDGVSIHVAGHEVGEPLLDTDAVRQGVGSDVFRLLNEDAATLATTVVVPNRIAEGELPPECLETQALQLLGIYLRYIDTQRGVAHLEPYYKGMGLPGLIRMVDSGLIKFVDNELRIDLTAVNRLYELSMMDFKKQVAIADSKDRHRAQDYLSRIQHAEKIPEIAYLIRMIHPMSGPEGN